VVAGERPSDGIVDGFAGIEGKRFGIERFGHAVVIAGTRGQENPARHDSLTLPVSA
jgi:hypothetical protein